MPKNRLNPGPALIQDPLTPSQSQRQQGPSLPETARQRDHFPAVVPAHYLDETLIPPAIAPN